MVTKEIVKLLSERLNISQRQAKDLLELQVKAITSHLQRRHNIITRDFGTVGIKEVPARRAYIPSEKILCEIPAHQKIFFRAANKLKELVKSWRPS
ncbi:MAG: HU family DNA-binding protein [Chromatiales bacterium]|nr:HU family DNA-binding protein [Chromatiales bacterium]